MTAEQRQLILRVPTGRCRTCRQVVKLDDTEIPTLTGNGRLQVRGRCPGCTTPVTALFAPSLLSELRQQQQPWVVVSVAMGLRSGIEAEAARARAARGDAALHLQETQGMKIRELAAAFNIGRTRMAQDLADARRRADQTKGEEHGR